MSRLPFGRWVARMAGWARASWPASSAAGRAAIRSPGVLASVQPTPVAQHRYLHGRSGRFVHQARAVGEADGLDAIADTEFGEDVVDVRLDRRLGEE